jgi:hypothetical protein
MYQIVSTLSIIARFIICWLTIENFPIFANDTIQWVFWQILSIYTILRLICYSIVWEKSKKYWIKSATQRSIAYFILYIPLALVTCFILRLLTKLHILPI